MTDEAQPGTTSLVANLIHKTYIVIATLRRNTPTPSMAMNLSGIAENEVIPSKASANIRFKGYFVSPAKRSLRSY